MSLKIYHNPRCSKSRQTLALLKDNGYTPHIITYLDGVLSAEDIQDLLSMLDMSSARDLMRTGESIYKELGLKMVEDETKLISAMVENPKLIERPIVVRNGKASIGRPPESVLALF
ncbi:MAG: arsenate reductase (glutaredoxin) [Robiginitomaculum sp.]|nr:arsenate reductase (glutaredoxin) [Robiginitomaculum sp.]